MPAPSGSIELPFARFRPRCTKRTQSSITGALEPVEYSVSGVSGWFLPTRIMRRRPSTVDEFWRSVSGRVYSVGSRSGIGGDRSTLRLTSTTQAISFIAP